MEDKLPPPRIPSRSPHRSTFVTAPATPAVPAPILKVEEKIALVIFPIFAIGLIYLWMSDREPQKLESPPPPAPPPMNLLVESTNVVRSGLQYRYMFIMSSNSDRDYRGELVVLLFSAANSKVSSGLWNVAIPAGKATILNLDCGIGPEPIFGKDRCTNFTWWAKMDGREVAEGEGLINVVP